MVMKIKYFKKVSLLSKFGMQRIVALMICLLFTGVYAGNVYANDDVIVVSPTIEISNPGNTVTVGDKGEIKYTINDVFDVPADGKVNFFVSDESKLKLENGNWEAVSAGTVWVGYTVKLSDETENAIKEKYSKNYIVYEETMTGFYVNIVEPDVTKSVYRLYNPNTGEHFFTQNNTEKNNLSKIGWNYEGISWRSMKANGVPVYRLYNPNTGDHHYTTNVTERNTLTSVGWRYEGIAWNSLKEGKPVYRLYNPNAKCGSHHYTMNAGERDSLVKAGWRYEGVCWYSK